MPALRKQHHSKKEYFDLLSDTDQRLEYHEGEIFNMAGGSVDHSIIIKNVLVYTENQLEDSSCTPYGSELGIKISDARYVYPDLSFVCGEPEDEDRRFLLNPVLVVEVLSPGTSRYDRDAKFLYYQSVLSVQAYLLIDSVSYTAILHTRSANSAWRTLVLLGLDKIVPLECIGLELPLAQVYRNTRYIGEETER